MCVLVKKKKKKKKKKMCFFFPGVLNQMEGTTRSFTSLRPSARLSQAAAQELSSESCSSPGFWWVEPQGNHQEATKKTRGAPIGVGTTRKATKNMRGSTYFETGSFGVIDLGAPMFDLSRNSNGDGSLRAPIFNTQRCSSNVILY